MWSLRCRTRAGFDRSTRGHRRCVTRLRAFGLLSAALIPLCAVGCGKPTGSPSGTSGSPPGGGVASTGTTVSAIEQKLKAETTLAGTDIKVKQEYGSISLEGTVSSQAQKDKAEQIVTEVQKQQNQQVGVLDNLMIKEGGTGKGAESGGGTAGGNANGGQ